MKAKIDSAANNKKLDSKTRAELSQLQVWWQVPSQVNPAHKVTINSQSCQSTIHLVYSHQATINAVYACQGVPSTWSTSTKLATMIPAHSYQASI